MNIVETKISETSVRLRYADNADPAKATQWMDFQFPLGDLLNSEKKPFADLQLEFLVEVQRGVLRQARDLVGAEMKRIADLAGRIS